MATTTCAKRRTPGRSTAEMLAAASHALTLVGVVAGSVPLFVRGWVHVTVRFAPLAGAPGGLLRRLGADVDAQIAAIAAREVNAAIAPTLWQYPGHAFRVLFALLLFVGATSIAAPPLTRRGRIIARAGACAGGIVAAVIVVVAFMRVNARIAALPARIADAMQGNALVRQTLVAAARTPQVSGGPGWPLVVVAVGVGFATIGALVGLILTVRRSDRKEVAVGDSRDAAAIPDNGPAPDAHRDAQPR